MDFRALTNLGVALRDEGRYAEAEEALRKALALERRHPNPWGNLGNILIAEGRPEEAELAFREALALAPEDWRPAYNLGIALLAQGRYSEGWPLYEKRQFSDRIPLPAWNGEPIAGQRIVVWPEQGLGDTIMCARYLPLLRDLGAAVTLVCHPAVAPLFSNLDLQVISRTQVLALPPAAYAVRDCSLPLRFNTTLDSIPPPVQLGAARCTAGGRIGLKWRGNSAHFYDAYRSLPAELAQQLLALPGVVSLEPEDVGATNLQETADLMAGLDRVVSVDTSVAHLAGSLGKPTDLILGARGVDWRWLYGRSDTPWYPSLTLHRQTRISDWSFVADLVRV